MPMPHHFRLAILLPGLVASSLFAQEPRLSPGRERAVRDAVRQYMTTHHIPGMSVAIAVDGRMVWASGFGYADLEHRVRADTLTLFRTASTLKPITATAVLQLAERGKLDLDGPVQRYCPSFPEKPWPITPRMLLLHRGGIRPSRGSDVFNSQHFMTVSDAVQRFAADTLNAKPGTTTIYSNEGYVVLACAIEGASGGSYDEYVKRAVLLPSGMPHTQPENVYEVLPHLSRSYLVRTAENTKAWEGLWTPVQLALIQLYVPAVAERVDPSHFPGAGNYRSTPSDMLRFMLALESGKLVSDSMRAFELATDFPLTDGKPSGRSMGWQVTPMDDRLVPRMLGSDWNGSFGILTLPDKRFSIAIASNIEFDIPYDLVRRIASLWGFLRPSE